MLLHGINVNDTKANTQYVLLVLSVTEPLTRLNYVLLELDQSNDIHVFGGRLKVTGLYTTCTLLCSSHDDRLSLQRP